MPKFTLILEGDSINEVITVAQSLTREVFNGQLTKALDVVGDRLVAVPEAIDGGYSPSEPLEREPTAEVIPHAIARGIVQVDPGHVGPPREGSAAPPTGTPGFVEKMGSALIDAEDTLEWAPEPPGVDMDAVFAIDVDACRFGRGFRWTEPELHFLTSHEDATTLYEIYRDVFMGTPVAAFNRSKNAVLQKWHLCRKAEGLQSPPKKPAFRDLTEDEHEAIRVRSQELTGLMLQNQAKHAASTLETRSKPISPPGPGTGSDPDNGSGLLDKPDDAIPPIQVGSHVEIISCGGFSGRRGEVIQINKRSKEGLCLIKMNDSCGVIWVYPKHLKVIK